MPQPGYFKYRIEDEPEEHPWADSCFPCSDEDVVLRIAEHVEETRGRAPAVVHLCWALHQKGPEWDQF